MPLYYKLLAGDLWHHGFVYEEGLNVDPLPFDPVGKCQPGGLYFTTLEHIPKWYNPHWWLIAYVSLPDDARVYAETCGTKWKADKLVLSKIQPLADFFITLHDVMLRQLLAQNGLMLQHVINQTDALCLAAVQENGLALEFVHKQSDEICLAAVQQYGYALPLVHNQTEEICLAATQQQWSMCCAHVNIVLTF